MKRLIAILFLSLLLLTNTQLGQLMKLPVLVQHYQEHTAMYKGMSFISFLKLHYFNGDPKDADYHRDMQLPFKSAESHINISVFIPFIQSFELNKTFYSIKQSFIPQNNDFYSSSHLDNIWQPPKA